MNKKERSHLGRAFDRWMFLYLSEPETFQREFESVEQYYADADGTPSQYGQNCVAFLAKCLKDTK